MAGRVAGKVALVTGGASGIGRACAERLAQEGAVIVVTDLQDAKGAEVVEAIKAAGGKAEYHHHDVTSEAAWIEVAGKIKAAHGRLDILVNNAGIIRRNDALEFTEDDWDAVMDVNLKTTFFLTQAVAKQMLAQGRGGKIINVASMLSYQGGIRVASYTASKSGLAGITKLLANEWAAKGINVNAIAPGYFATNNTEALRADEGRTRDIMARIPAGRWGEPSDLGGAAVFLASAASDYVHGTLLPVDGGWLAR